jgi:hypothetical protein
MADKNVAFAGMRIGKGNRNIQRKPAENLNSMV